MATIDQAALDALRRGVTIDGMVYGAIEAKLDRVQGTNVWLTVGLREGKNREVKRVLEHLGLAVNRLIRVSYGPFQLGDLARGRGRGSARPRAPRPARREARARRRRRFRRAAPRPRAEPKRAKKPHESTPRRRNRMRIVGGTL